MKLKTAFTLIELLVVIAIIGILSGLIVVSMSGVTQKANIAKAQVFSNSLKNSLMLNLVSEWKFDENTGTTAFDSWSGGNNGTLSGSVLPIWKNSSECINGSCLYFDGANSYVDCGTNSSLDMGADDSTVSIWAKFDNETPPTAEETLIFSGGIVGTSAGYWIRREIGGSAVYFCFNDGSTSRISGGLSASGTLVANNWYNIVVVMDRDGYAQSYINGVLQSQKLSISSRAGNIENTYNLQIGGWGTNYNIKGKIDEVRLYNSIIPISKIKEGYFLGINNLIKNGAISKEEYKERMHSLAINK